MLKPAEQASEMAAEVLVCRTGTVRSAPKAVLAIDRVLETAT
jgi:hypothetical protein